LDNERGKLLYEDSKLDVLKNKISYILGGFGFIFVFLIFFIFLIRGLEGHPSLGEGFESSLILTSITTPLLIYGIILTYKGFFLSSMLVYENGICFPTKPLKYMKLDDYFVRFKKIETYKMKDKIIFIFCLEPKGKIGLSDKIISHITPEKILEMQSIINKGINDEFLPVQEF